MKRNFECGLRMSCGFGVAWRRGKDGLQKNGEL